MRRLPPWIAIALGIILLGVLVRVALPTVLARVAAAQLSELLSARVEVGDVDLWVLDGSVAVEELAIRAPDAEQPWLASKRATVDASWLALFRGQFDIEQVELDGVDLALVLDRDGRITWVGAPPHAEPAEEEPPEADAGEPTEVSLDSIALRDIDFSLRDESGSRTVGVALDAAELGPIRLVLGEGLQWSVAVVKIESTEARLRNDDATEVAIGLAVTADDLGSGPGEPSHFDLNLKLGNGSLHAKGTFGLSPLAADAELSWKEVELAPLLALVPADSRPDIASGVTTGSLTVGFHPAADAASGGSGDAGAEKDSADPGAAADPKTATPGGAGSGSAGPPAGLTGSGSVEVQKLDLTLAGDAPLRVAWNALSLGLDSLEIDPTGERSPRIHLSKVDLAAPDVRYTSTPEAAEPGDEGAKSEGEAESGPPRVRIDALGVTDGKLRFRDASFDPPLETAVSGVSVTGRTLRWPAMAAKDLKAVIGSLGKGPPLTLTFSGRRDAGKGSLRGERISLLIAAPYVRRQSDYAIERGQLSIDSEFETEGRHYSAPTRVVLHDLRVDGSDADSGFRETFGVSLEMALVLLRNQSGDIVLDLPIEGDETAAGVGLTRVVADTLRRVLFNALATPLKLAGGLLGDKEEGPSFVGRAFRFVPGSDEAEDEEGSEERRAAVAKLLTDSPDLGIRIEAVMVPKDLSALARRAGIEAGDEGNPSPEALELLRKLATERLAGTREAIVDALGDRVGDLERRLVVVPWKPPLGSGTPRVVARLVLHQD